MITVRVSRKDNNELHLIRIEVDEASIKNFIALVDRALNCWDSAPKELKDLGDMLTHDRITQAHGFVPINTKQSSDYYSAAEQQTIDNFIQHAGLEAWLEHTRAGTQNKVLKGEG